MLSEMVVRLIMLGAILVFGVLGAGAAAWWEFWRER
jgi:hypothetical protein